MGDDNEQLVFTYQPKVVKYANDEPEEEPPAETHDAIDVYFKGKDTDFVSPLKTFKESENEMNVIDGSGNMYCTRS